MFYLKNMCHNCIRPKPVLLLAGLRSICHDGVGGGNALTWSVEAGRQAISYCEIKAQPASDECMLQDGCDFCMLQPQAVAWYNVNMALETLCAGCRWLMGVAAV